MHHRLGGVPRAASTVCSCTSVVLTTAPLLLGLARLWSWVATASFDIWTARADRGHSESRSQKHLAPRTSNPGHPSTYCASHQLHAERRVLDQTMLAQHVQVGRCRQHPRRPRETSWAHSARARSENTKICRFLVNCISTLWLNAAMKQLACAPTFQWATKYPPKWNYSEHLNQPQPTRNVRQGDVTKSHWCRTAKSAPKGTHLTPWRAEKRQQQRHLRVTSNKSYPALCVRAYC